MSIDAVNGVIVDKEKTKRIRRVVREIDRALASAPEQASAFVESFPAGLLDHLEAILVRVKTIRLALESRRVSSRRVETD